MGFITVKTGGLSDAERRERSRKMIGKVYVTTNKVFAHKVVGTEIGKKVFEHGYIEPNTVLKVEGYKSDYIIFLNLDNRETYEVLGSDINIHRMVESVFLTKYIEDITLHDIDIIANLVYCEKKSTFKKRWRRKRMKAEKKLLALHNAK